MIDSGPSANGYDSDAQAADALEPIRGQRFGDTTGDLLPDVLRGRRALNQHGRRHSPFSKPTNEIHLSNRLPQRRKDASGHRALETDVPAGPIAQTDEHEQEAVSRLGGTTPFDAEEVAKRGLVVGTARGTTVKRGVPWNRIEPESLFWNPGEH
jgi:hypothetical protein